MTGKLDREGLFLGNRQLGVFGTCRVALVKRDGSTIFRIVYMLLKILPMGFELGLGVVLVPFGGKRPIGLAEKRAGSVTGMMVAVLFCKDSDFRHVQVAYVGVGNFVG